MLENALIIGFSLFLTRFIGAEAALQYAHRRGTDLHFPVGIGLRFLFRLGGPFLLFVAYKVNQEATFATDWLMVALLILMGLGCILGEPGEIVVTSDGILQQSILGLWRRRVQWGGAAANHSAGVEEVMVIGHDGVCIAHSKYHVGQSQFLHQLTRHGVLIQR